ncbi:GTP cyclohydrolase FolE2 [Aestuariibacter sp. AA17]|uniref:GTP cyclohydrolase FolE2 n=1 Tax=Fluctibacter corallii TaxID=2984329 RepID=A0ABT3A779_9ALTE|nr:GTP cyclohydrolase FolE2 [Aestuariibacter sp. AA17]MCV2884176.1 GTP cyclohydrolase FolE2 [Aestuariibacter sp. AA17]
MSNYSHMPDITSGLLSPVASPLQWVGMEKIAVPIQLLLSEEERVALTASADVFVSLDDESAKGIHMSRLYLLLKNTLPVQPLNSDILDTLLDALIVSQQGLSRSAKLSLQFDLTLRKPAMKSTEFGFQVYPVSLTCERVEGKTTYSLSLTIPYSSTCPCSAALSRQVLKEAIELQFTEETLSLDALTQWIVSEQGSIATPHSQRSYAYISLVLGDSDLPNISSLIKEFEEIIGTPVQTAVKREDEQAFARLNAENLMFCEDAARRLKFALEANSHYTDYWFKVEHQESLHAHNAVVIDQKFPASNNKVSESRISKGI